MKQYINSLLKLSGKPINAVKEKTHLTYDEMSLIQELIKILSNSHHPVLLPSGVSREEFIRTMIKLGRWVVTRDCESDKLIYYSGMRKGTPVLDNNRIRIYKTRSGAEQAIKRIVDSGQLSKQKLGLAHIWLLTGD